MRSLTLAEPARAALLVDRPEARAALEERRRGFEPIVAMRKSGDAASATRMFFDLVDNHGEGAFERQPEPFRRMVMDTARTLPLLLPALASARTAAISSTGLGGVTAPTLVVGGADTLSYFALTNEVVARCIPDSRLVIVP